MLVSAVQQCRSAITIHVSPPSGASLLPRSQLSGPSQRVRLGSLCHTATSHQLSILYMVVDICQRYFLHLWHSFLPLLCMYNIILLSHKKQWLGVSSNKVDETRACYTEWNKLGKTNILMHIHGIRKNGTDELICREGMEMQIWRTMQWHFKNISLL